MSQELGVYDRNDADGAIGRKSVTGSTFSSKTVLDAAIMPLPVQRRISYNSDNQTEYEGYAPINAATSESVWAIKKITYNASKLPVREQWHLNGKWDSKASYF